MYTPAKIATRLAALTAAVTVLSIPSIVISHNEQVASITATAELASATGLHHEQLRVYPAVVTGRVNAAAEAALQEARRVASVAEAKVDTTEVATTIASLANYKTLDSATVAQLTGQAATLTAQTQAAADEHDRQAAAAAAEAARVANTPDGARATARDLAASQYGWGGDQFQCLNQLWTKESGWNYQAVNTNGGATGIPQSLPGSKMATFGADWQTNATTQIRWGLDYIARGYGSPCAAWAHSVAVNWY
jgi:hypothetical protein